MLASGYSKPLYIATTVTVVVEKKESKQKQEHSDCSQPVFTPSVCGRLRGKVICCLSVHQLSVCLSVCLSVSTIITTSLGIQGSGWLVNYAIN